MDKKNSKKMFLLVFLAIITYWGINNLSIIGNCINKIVEIVFPFILGGGLAFILNIPMSFFEKKLEKLKYKKKLFKENNLNYKIFHPSDLINHTMEELFDFLNISKIA